MCLIVLSSFIWFSTVIISCNGGRLTVEKAVGFVWHEQTSTTWVRNLHILQNILRSIRSSAHLAFCERKCIKNTTHYESWMT